MQNLRSKNKQEEEIRRTRPDDLDPLGNRFDFEEQFKVELAQWGEWVRLNLEKSFVDINARFPLMLRLRGLYLRAKRRGVSIEQIEIEMSLIAKRPNGIAGKIVSLLAEFDDSGFKVNEPPEKNDKTSKKPKRPSIFDKSRELYPVDFWDFSSICVSLSNGHPFHIKASQKGGDTEKRIRANLTHTRKARLQMLVEYDKELPGESLSEEEIVAIGYLSEKHARGLVHYAKLNKPLWRATLNEETNEYILVSKMESNCRIDGQNPDDIIRREFWMEGLRDEFLEDLRKDEI